MSRVRVYCAVPVNEEQFNRMYESGQSDFIGMLRRGRDISAVALWREYRSLAGDMRAMFGRIEALGAEILCGTPFEELARMPECDTLVVIAHHSCRAPEIELIGRMMSEDDFVSGFPCNFREYADVTSCYSERLMSRLILACPPGRHFIGEQDAAGLNFRMYLLEKTVSYMADTGETSYRDALEVTANMLQASIMPNGEAPEPGRGKKPWEKVAGRLLGGLASFVLGGLPDYAASATPSIVLPSPAPRVRLGDEDLRSTVYAPARVARGDSFMVQVYIHAQADRAEVTLRAREVDADAEERNSRSLSFPLRMGDRLDFQLSQTPRPSADFYVESDIKGFMWTGQAESVEFAVAVEPDCRARAFLGKIKIALNGVMQGDVSFKTAVGGATDNSCAVCCFSREDRNARIAAARRLLSEKLDALRARAKEEAKPEVSLLRDIAMCEKCLELHAESLTAHGDILKVFISSTSDLASCRMAVKRQVENCAMYADMYENWGQESRYPRDMCCSHVMDSDIFVCILGGNYGFVEPIWDASMTEIEYNIATLLDIPALVYISSDFEKGSETSSRQTELIDRLRLERMVRFFPNESQLAQHAAGDLSQEKSKLLRRQDL